MGFWGQDAQREFVREGHCVLRGAITLELVQRARAAVDERLSASGPAALASAGRDPALLALFHGSPLASTMRDAIGRLKPVRGCQVTLRYPQGGARRGNIPDAPQDANPFGWGGHIDGMNAFFHAEPIKTAGQVPWPNDHFMNFDCLVGVALSDQSSEDCGNLALLSRSHTANAAFFAAQREAGGPLGPGGPGFPLTFGTGRALPPPSHQLPGVTGADGAHYPRPTQARLQPGDVVLAHYLTGHGPVENRSDRTRYMVYFRLSHADSNTPHQGEGRSGASLCDAWHNWPGLRPAIAAEEAACTTTGAASAQDHGFRMQPAASTTAETESSGDALRLVPRETVSAFQTNGFVVTQGLLGDSSDIQRYRHAVDAAVASRTAGDTRTLSERTRYERSFVQCMRLWETDPAVAQLTFHPKLAQAAAELLGVSGVCLWQDQALYKQAGGRSTDPHQDAPFWPIGNAPLISAWIPLNAVPLRGMGYVAGSHKHGRLKVVDLGRTAETCESARRAAFTTLTLCQCLGSIYATTHMQSTIHVHARN